MKHLRKDYGSMLKPPQRKRARRTKNLVAVFVGRGDPTQEQTDLAMKALAEFKATEVLPGTLELRADPESARRRMLKLDGWRLSEPKSFKVAPPSPAGRAFGLARAKHFEQQRRAARALAESDGTSTNLKPIRDSEELNQGL